MNDTTNYHSYKLVSTENYKSRRITIESFMDSTFGSLLPEHPGALDLTFYVFRIDGVLNNLLHASEQSAKETARRIIGKNTKEDLNQWLACGGCFHLGKPTETPEEYERRQDARAQYWEDAYNR